MEKKRITESARQLKVAAEYDVVIAGGGVAGAAAAVAAARREKSVCLLEKESALGGLATLGNVIVWLPICDGMGQQIIGGIAEEMLRISIADLGRDNSQARFTGIPPCWESGGDLKERKNKRFRVAFNPSSYLLTLEKWVLEANVQLWYDTRLCATQRGKDRITHLIVENKSGRMAIAGKAFVDASGDADLCHLAGEPTESLDSNVLCGWFYYLVDGVLHLKPYSNPYSHQMTRAGADGPFFRGDNGRQVTEMIVGSRRLIREQLAVLRQKHTGSEVQIFAPPTIACFRATRRLNGIFSLGRQHVHQWFDDTVALTGDWRQCGPVYAIPRRCLSGVNNCNLTVAGRCISVDTSLWDCARAIPACATTGEAAGTMAALAAANENHEINKIETGRLQRNLRDAGVIIEPDLVIRNSGVY